MSLIIPHLAKAYSAIADGIQTEACLTDPSSANPPMSFGVGDYPLVDSIGNKTTEFLFLLHQEIRTRHLRATVGVEVRRRSIQAYLEIHANGGPTDKNINLYKLGADSISEIGIEGPELPQTLDPSLTVATFLSAMRMDLALSPTMPTLNASVLRANTELFDPLGYLQIKWDDLTGAEIAQAHAKLLFYRQESIKLVEKKIADLRLVRGLELTASDRESLVREFIQAKRSESYLRFTALAEFLPALLLQPSRQISLAGWQNALIAQSVIQLEVRDRLDRIESRLRSQPSEIDGDEVALVANLSAVEAVLSRESKFCGIAHTLRLHLIKAGSARMATMGAFMLLGMIPNPFAVAVKPGVLLAFQSAVMLSLSTNDYLHMRAEAERSRSLLFSNIRPVPGQTLTSYFELNDSISAAQVSGVIAIVGDLFFPAANLFRSAKAARLGVTVKRAQMILPASVTEALQAAR